MMCTACDLLELLGRWGPCPTFENCGAVENGSSFEANGSPGCDSLACCETVCAVQPLCCSQNWSSACRNLAATLCGQCGEPGSGDCCTANGTQGCQVPACCLAVCVVDAFCCLTEWDDLCDERAAEICAP